MKDISVGMRYITPIIITVLAQKPTKEENAGDAIQVLGKRLMQIKATLQEKI